MWRDRFAGSLSAAMSDQEVTIADIPPLTPLLLEATKTQ
jgi:hypothetical protein